MTRRTHKPSKSRRRDGYLALGMSNTLMVPRQKSGGGGPAFPSLGLGGLNNVPLISWGDGSPGVNGLAANYMPWPREPNLVRLSATKALLVWLAENPTGQDNTGFFVECCVLTNTGTATAPNWTRGPTQIVASAVAGIAHDATWLSGYATGTYTSTAGAPFSSSQAAVTINSVCAALDADGVTVHVGFIMLYRYNSPSASFNVAGVFMATSAGANYTTGNWTTQDVSPNFYTIGNPILATANNIAAGGIHSGGVTNGSSSVKVVLTGSCPTNWLTGTWFMKIAGLTESGTATLSGMLGKITAISTTTTTNDTITLGIPWNAGFSITGVASGTLTTVCNGAVSWCPSPGVMAPGSVFPSGTICFGGYLDSATSLGGESQFPFGVFYTPGSPPTITTTYLDETVSAWSENLIETCPAVFGSDIYFTSRVSIFQSSHQQTAHFWCRASDNYGKLTLPVLESFVAATCSCGVVNDGSTANGGKGRLIRAVVYDPWSTDDVTYRNRMVLLASNDGLTWTGFRTIYYGISGYNSLCVPTPGNLLLAFETATTEGLERSSGDQWVVNFYLAALTAAQVYSAQSQPDYFDWQFSELPDNVSVPTYSSPTTAYGQGCWGRDYGPLGQHGTFYGSPVYGASGGVTFAATGDYITLQEPFGTALQFDALSTDTGNGTIEFELASSGTPNAGTILGGDPLAIGTISAPGITIQFGTGGIATLTMTDGTNTTTCSTATSVLNTFAAFVINRTAATPTITPAINGVLGTPVNIHAGMGTVANQSAVQTMQTTDGNNRPKQSGTGVSVTFNWLRVTRGVVAAAKLLTTASAKGTPDGNTVTYAATAPINQYTSLRLWLGDTVSGYYNRCGSTLAGLRSPDNMPVGWPVSGMLDSSGHNHFGVSLSGGLELESAANIIIAEKVLDPNSAAPAGGYFNFSGAAISGSLGLVLDNSAVALFDAIHMGAAFAISWMMQVPAEQSDFNFDAAQYTLLDTRCTVAGNTNGVYIFAYRDGTGTFYWQFQVFLGAAGNWTQSIGICSIATNYFVGVWSAGNGRPYYYLYPFTAAPTLPTWAGGSAGSKVQFGSSNTIPSGSGAATTNQPVVFNQRASLGAGGTCGMFPYRGMLKNFCFGSMTNQTVAEAAFAAMATYVP